MKLKARQRTDLWPSEMEWRYYESYVFGTLQRLNPGSTVRHNMYIPGRFSGRSRQVDILVERRIGGRTFGIAVDCKCYKRRVNVKHVEAFLGMLEDLGISKGVIVTTKGYSKAAFQRAKGGSQIAELYIISPDRLSLFQHIGDAILWVEPMAAVLNTPEGWVADNKDSRPEREQVSMYLLGHTRDSAQRLGAYIYGNIILKSARQPNMESIANGHERAVVVKFPAAQFNRLPLDAYFDGPTKITSDVIFRVGHIDASYNGPEYSIYIDHPKGVLLLVLLCPEGEDEKYVPILKKLAKTALLLDCVDERPSWTREVNGRISVYWNRAKFTQVYERPNTQLPWTITQEYVEITEQLRQQPQPSLEENGKFAIESCEFIDRIIPVDSKMRREVAGEGWAIPLWNSNTQDAKPRVILHLKGVEEPAQIIDPEHLVFFTSTRLPFSSDCWPSVPGVDLVP